MLERKKLASEKLLTHVGALFLNSEHAHVDREMLEIDLSLYTLDTIKNRSYYKIGLMNLAQTETSGTLSAWLIFAEEELFDTLQNCFGRI